MGSKTILLTGASGYLGQHILSHWITTGLVQNESDSALHVKIVAVVNQCRGLSQAIQAIERHKLVSVSVQHCNLTNPIDLENLFQRDGPFDVCVHCAAVSSPMVCQRDPEKATLVNLPELFFRKIPPKTTVIALSTDQVYNGLKDTESEGLYSEEYDKPDPKNVYGQTKLQMEFFLKENRPSTSSTVILRSSIILGPKAPFSQAHDTFLHFCASRDKQETQFFTNEWRNAVGVSHICCVVDWLIHNLDAEATATDSPYRGGYEVYNLGGPERVNRYNIAEAVFDFFGYDKKYLRSAVQTSETSPLDISMDSSKLYELTGIAHAPSTLEGMILATFSHPQAKVAK